MRSFAEIRQRAIAKTPGDIPPRLKGNGGDTERLDKIDKARRLSLTGQYSLQEIAAICGMSEYLCEMALQWNEIDDIVKKDGEAECKATIERHRSQRKRAR
jgi:hypothetical protein